MRKYSLKKLIQLAVKKPVVAIILVAAIIFANLLEMPIIGANDENGLCKVNSVYDGDTMRLTCHGQKTKVRLYCIDTPEMEQRPWGNESRDFLRSITPDLVSLRAYDKDRYGRLVVEVFADDKNLNLAMVEHGQAAVYSRYCSQQPYYDRQQQAQAKKLGIWTKPGLHQEPWNWRKQKHASKQN